MDGVMRRELPGDSVEISVVTAVGVQQHYGRPGPSGADRDTFEHLCGIVHDTTVHDQMVRY
jgi:hypothetical protein